MKGIWTSPFSERVGRWNWWAHYPRVFDTSAPVNGEGYGTPGLTGDAGNVLVVQQTGGNTQWKANEAGGVLVFEFVTPVEELVQIRT